MKTDSSIAILRTSQRHGSATGWFKFRPTGFVERTYGEGDGCVIKDGDRYVIRIRHVYNNEASIMKVKHCFNITEADVEEIL